MPIDASIYNNLNTTAYNPLDAVTKAATLGNALLQQQQTQLQNMNAAAKIRYNQILADNTDSSGNTDYNKAKGQAAVDKIAAPYIAAGQDITNTNLAPTNYLGQNAKGQPQLMQRSLQAQNQALGPQSNPLQGQQQNIQSPQPTQDDIDQAHDHFNTLADAGSDLLGKKNLSTSDLINTVADLHSLHATSNGTKGINLQEGSNLLGNAPNDPYQLRPYIQSNIDKVRQMQAQLTMNSGPPSNAKTMTNPSIAAGLTPGYEGQVKDVVDTQNQINQEAKAALAVKQPLQKAYDLVNSGAPTGTAAQQISSLYNAAVAAGYATPGMEKSNQQIVELSKYISQINEAQGANSRTNEGLRQLQSSNINIEQAPKVIKDLLRSMMAANQGAISKQNAYNHIVGTNTDPQKTLDFNNNWNDNYDQRAIELGLTPKEQHKEYLNPFSSDDLKKILKSRSYLKSIGALQQ